MTRNTLIRSVCWASFILWLAYTADAQTTVYNNFGPEHGGWDYTYTTGWTVAGVNVPNQYGVEQAMSFTSTADGAVSDIWVAFFYVPFSTLPDTVTIKLARNPYGVPPDSAEVMEQWVITSFESWYQWTSPIHLEGNGSSRLQEGEDYWIWAIGGETTWCGWCLNINPALTCPHTLRREGENWLPVANETASAFRVDVNATAPVSVTLTPAWTPIQIPSTGGSFDFNIAVSNTGSLPVTVDFWTMVTLPHGREYGPLILVNNFSLAAGLTLERDRTQNVPGTAPSGAYTYTAYLGDYPNTILDEDHFTFEKLTAGAAGFQITGWECSGESFGDQTSDLSLSPSDFSLLPAYPNPFNSYTALSYELRAASFVSLKVYDTAGRLVATLVDGMRQAGKHEVTFDGSGLASGIYLAKLEAGEFRAVQKLILMK